MKNIYEEKIFNKIFNNYFLIFISLLVVITPFWLPDLLESDGFWQGILFVGFFIVCIPKGYEEDS